MTTNSINRYKQQLRRRWALVKRWSRLRWLYTQRWWKRNDRHYGLWWRIGNGGAAVLILVAAVIPVLQQVSNSNSYKLSADALSLVGNTDQTLTKQLTYDSSTATYQFNKDAVKSDSNNSLAAMQNQVGTASGQGKDKSLYALDVPADLSKGVTYHDINSQLSFSLVPQFKAEQGKDVNGHLVYPLAGNTQAIYTLKNNGLKEDIVVPKATTDTMTFNYTLDLPKTLEAKVIPDSDGAIGIYSADPTLFGNISYGSSKDQAAVEKARENGAKTNLVFGLPSPIIKAADGGSIGDANARFQLSGNQLSVVAEGLSDISTSFTVDPSVVVTSTSDFQAGGNYESNIDFSTSGQITRGGLTGGSIGSWTQATNKFTTNREGAGAVVYNGNMYVLGGTNITTDLSDVQYAAINTSDGSMGTWASTTSFTNARGYLKAVAYDNYMYIFGGYTRGNTYYNDVQYAPINSNGTLGTWHYTHNSTDDGTSFVAGFTTARGGMGVNVNNGYVYLTGGWDGTNAHNDVQYAPLNANGTIGTWTTSGNSFTTARAFHGAVIYNNYLYIFGGSNFNGNAHYSDAQYTSIKADGSIGSWASTTSLPANTSAFAGSVIGGYLYVTGGTPNDSTRMTTAYYAPINANGSVGAWRSATSIATGSFYQTGVAYNNYVYTVGGFGGSNNSDNTDILYAKIDPAGTAGTYTTSANTFTARRGGQTIASNGYLFIIGGDSGSTPLTTNSVTRASLNADGSIGTFTSTTAFTTSNYETYGAAVAYNGFMYVIGGCNSAYSSCTTASNNLTQVLMSPINPTNGSLSSWTAQTGTITTARYGLSAAAYNGYLYVMGGLNGSTFQNDIQYIAIGTAGAITGTWTTSSKTLPSSEAYVASTVFGNDLYIAGGCTAGALTCTTTNNTVYYAPFDVSGDLGAALTSSGTFTTARGDFGLAANNGYLYITGGRTNTTYYNDTQFAIINNDGSVGTWAASTASVLATARYGIGVAASNGALYVTGGYDGTTYYGNVQYALVNNGGSGGGNTWTSNATDISGLYPTGWRYGQMFAANGYLYIVGGEDNGTTAYGNTYYAPINSDGSVGSWSSTGSLVTARFSFGFAMYNGYVYVMGGKNSIGTTLATSEYAALNSNGSLTWAATGTSFTARSLNSSAAYNGYIYSLGGNNSSGTTQSDTQYAPLNSNGTIGTWSTTNSFTGIRFGFGAVTYNGYLYVMGGHNGTTYLNDVQYAPLNSDGTITSGTWKYTTSLRVTRRYLNAMISNGFLYVVNGGNSGNALKRVDAAPILANGNIGAWQTTGTESSAARNSGASTIYNGVLYIAGGWDGATTFPTDLQYTSLNQIPKVGHYSKLIDLGAATNVTSVTYNGVLPTGAGAITYRTAGSNGVLGSSALANTIGGSGNCVGNTTNVRYIWISVTLDDSNSGSSSIGGSYPDITGAASLNANLTDFTVNYNPVHPAPNIRLRTGQTLQSGNLSSLDTCYP